MRTFTVNVNNVAPTLNTFPDGKKLQGNDITAEGTTNINFSLHDAGFDNGAGGQLHLNDGAPSPTFTPHPERFVLAGARSAALGKISVDARDDVIVASSGGLEISWRPRTPA